MVIVMTKHLKKTFFGFTVPDILLWTFSMLIILGSFFALGQSDSLSLISSIVGVTAILFNAKGNPFGHILMIAFGTMYAGVSYACAYYGEMITYLGMTVPMAVLSLISWFRHPYNGNRAEVAVRRFPAKEIPLLTVLALAVTAVFYFVLDALGTASLWASTLSITTSFVAAYLTFRRSEFFALAYAANDIVLILLWILAAKRDTSYLSVFICFVVFLINDIYSFFSWIAMRRRQAQEK